MTDHKCVEWIKGYCTECDVHYTDYIDKLHAALKEFEALKDRFDNGIKYDEELNVYTVRWTERELKNAQKAAAEIYEKINWGDPQRVERNK